MRMIRLDENYYETETVKDMCDINCYEELNAPIVEGMKVLVDCDISKNGGEYILRNPEDISNIDSWEVIESRFFTEEEIDLYVKLKDHVGHNIVCVQCEGSEQFDTVCIKCEDCNEVIISAEFVRFDEEE